MDTVSLITIGGMITIFISLFLAFFLLTVVSKHRTSNRIFAAFLIITTIDISGFLFNFAPGSPTNLGMFRNMFIFFQVPIFYIYVISVTYSDFRLKPKHLFHTIPFIIANLLLFPRYYNVSVSSKIDFLAHHQTMIELKLNHTLLHIQVLVYIVIIFIILKRTKRLYQQNYAGANIKSYKWLFQFTIALTIFYAIALLKNIFKFSQYDIIFEWIRISLFLFQFIIICWYLFKALNNPDLFKNIDSKLELVTTPLSKTSAKPIHIETEDAVILTKLKEYMQLEKPFLDPSITIQNISKQLDIPTRELSLLINHKIGQHFFDFINTHRIEYAVSILEDPSKSHLTILEILYEVGFNSKSSFNTAFKKHTNTTPTSYRKNFINKTL